MLLTEYLQKPFLMQNTLSEIAYNTVLQCRLDANVEEQQD